MYFAVLQGGAENLSHKGGGHSLGHRAKVQAAGLSMSLVLRGYAAAVRRLGSFRVVGTAPPAPAIVCSWHHDLFFLLPERGPQGDWLALPPEKRLDPIARASESLGLQVLRERFGDDGSPPRHLVELVSEGRRALLSADGPHQPGLIRPEPVKLAAATGAPIVPVTLRAPHHARLPGGMQLVLPRGEIVLTYGAPIHVRRDDEDRATADLARALR